ncbi:MAG: hypothetical protein WCA10_23460 [Terracidiphilus sp.]
MKSLAIYLSICGLSLALPNAAGEVKANSSLEVKVSAPRSSVCVGDKAITIDITILNHGQSNIGFDSHHLHVNVGYGALFDTTTMKRRTEGIAIQQDRMASGSDQQTIIALEQNQAYVRQVSFPLPSSFFSQPGFYLLMPSVSIDAFSLKPDPKTGIIFEVRDCD